MSDERGGPPWLWPNLLSLDAPVVAVLWQGLFAATAGVHLPVAAHLLLGVAVWVIYVGDRLLDAARLDLRYPATERHLFYRKYRLVFSVAVFFVAVGGAAGAGYMLPEGLAVRGIFLGLLMVGYFAYVGLLRRGRGFLVPKEVLCGVFFALGTNLAPAFSASHSSVTGRGVMEYLQEGLLGLGEAALSLPVGCFALLCVLNCTLIAVWESEEDAAQDPAALTRWRGTSGLSFSGACLFLAALGGGLAFLHRGEEDAVSYLCVCGSAAGLGALESYRAKISTRARRVLADAVLLTPLFVLPFIV